MVYRYQTLLLAIDHVQSAVSQELSSRYCPFDKTIFLTRFWALFALLVVGALSLSIAARRKWKRKWNAEAEAGPRLASIAGWALLAFALGSGALVLYGLSGCSGAAAAGLFWDWP